MLYFALGRFNMKKRLSSVILIAVALLIFLQGCKENLELIGSVESELLTLNVFSHPFSYEIREKASGEVLLRNTLSTFAFQDSFEATDVSDLKTGRDFLEANLVADGSVRAFVRFDFRGPAHIELAFNAPDAGQITQTFADLGEHYYGLWEYPPAGALDNRGASAQMLGFQKKHDANFCNARAPFYMTSKKYAIYAETFAKGQYTIACLGKTSFSFEAPELKYHILYGPSYADMLKAYNDIAGPPVMPPLWAFDSIWWRDDDHTGFNEGVANAQENVLQTASKLKDNRIRASAIWIDRPYGTGNMGWGNMDFDSSFPDPGFMISSLKADGYNLLLWITNRCINGLYTEGDPLGYLFYGYGGEWPASDVRRPEVYDWFRSKLDTFVGMGIKGYKIDRGEEGEMPLSAQNEVTYNFHKLSAEGLAAKNGSDWLMFARSAFDRSRQFVGVWNGDTDATFSSLRMSIKNGLRSGMINFPFWGSDVGGYIGGLIFTKELFARWLEFGAYSPMMEVLIGPNRTIWYRTIFNNFDDELLEIARDTTAMHHDLIPYTRSMMHQAAKTGMPVMRALVIAYPGDCSVHDIWDEYMYGSELLVAPVAVKNIRSRDIYLPEGKWLNYNNRYEIHQGPSVINEDAPLGVIPVFAKEGAIIPRGDILKSNNSWTPDWKASLRIEVFPAASGSSSFDYFTDNGVCRILSSTEDNTIRISIEDTGVAGVAEIYLNGFKRVKRNGEIITEGIDFTYDDASKLMKVNLSGAAAIEIGGTASLFR